MSIGSVDSITDEAALSWRRDHAIGRLIQREAVDLGWVRKGLFEEGDDVGVVLLELVLVALQRLH